MRTAFYILLTAFFTILLTIGSYIFFDSYSNHRSFSQLSQIIPIGPTVAPSPVPKPLEKYTILNLANRGGIASEIVLDQTIATTSSYQKYTFHYTSNGKKVTGIATVPVRNSLSPVIVQFRGYADVATYFPGQGTEHSAEYYAEHGFISLAPDFLGYGGSDKAADDPFENRFETYTTALDLIASIPSLKFTDLDRVALWGHSNGGHIAITVSEILNKPKPLIVWAPVTKYFPYSILHYMDEATDGGKMLRKELSKFETIYNSDEFTLTNYVDRLAGPIQFHQGTADEAVPKVWSDEFVSNVKKLNKDITYFTYPGADHNLQPGWSTVVQRDIDFLDKNLRKSTENNF